MWRSKKVWPTTKWKIQSLVKNVPYRSKQNKQGSEGNHAQDGQKTPDEFGGPGAEINCASLSR